MRVYSGMGLGSFYFKLLKDLRAEGRDITVRGRKCVEFKEPTTLEYTVPGACWMLIQGRKFNPFFALAEVVWILSGNGNVEWISYFNENMRQFQDGRKPDFHGAYGLRLRKWPSNKTHRGNIDQLIHTERKLREDPNTRQAVMSLWDPVRDNVVKSRDLPCNNIVYFSYREHRLDMTVVIRSNDLIWGTPYNAVQFTHILAYQAGILGVKPGKITYVVQNLHYYTDLYPETLNLLINRATTNPQEGHALRHLEFMDSVPWPKDFTNLKATIDRILHLRDIRKERDALKPSRFLPHLQKLAVHNHYWLGVIPQMIWAYVVVKEKLVSNNEIRSVAEMLLDLGEPFASLVFDFWHESKNPIAQDIAYEMVELDPGVPSGV